MKSHFTKKQLVLFGLIIVAILSILLYLFVIRTQEELPPTIAYEETREDNVEEYQTFFDRLTEYLKEHHGQIKTAEEISRSFSDEIPDRLIVKYLHHFKEIEEEKFFNAVGEFSRKEGVLYKIKKKKKKRKPYNEYYLLDFYKDNYLWITIEADRDQKPVPPPPPEKKKRVKKKNGKAKLVIIIDDFGYSYPMFRKFVSLDYDITYSILPQLENSDRIVNETHSAGREMMLHLPMEPKNMRVHNPGPGALLVKDSLFNIKKNLRTNLESVKYAVGVNNHMGSAFTQYPQGLDVVMKVMGENDLFFVDSKTSPGRIAKNSAKKYNVPFHSRNIFLDNERKVSKISRQLYKAVRIAKKRGTAIAIGHPYQSTYKALKQQLPKLEKENVEVVRMSELFN